MANPLETDPTLLALLDDAEVFVDFIRIEYRNAITTMAGVHIDAIYMMQAHTLIMAGERLVAGQLAARGAATRLAHDSYSLGLRAPKRRLTRAEQQLNDARAFGLCA